MVPLGVPTKQRMTRAPGGANARSWGAGARSIALWVAESALRKRGDISGPFIPMPNTGVHDKDLRNLAND